MKTNNVCKFPTFDPTNELSVFCFVRETNLDTAQQKNKLSHHRMILVEQGSGEFLIDDHTYGFSTGTLLFAFEGEYFSLSKGTDVRYLYIDFSGSRGQTLFHRLGVYPHCRKYENLNGLIPFCKDCLLSTQQENIDLVAESILLYVFSRLSATTAPQNAIIQRIIDLTEEHFRDPELSLAQIAQEIGYNPKYLSHFFKEKMEVGYSEYLRSFRFKYAISLFELGISSVKNVASLSGFSDPLYFSNAFKKAIGISPTEFIQNLSKDE
jgi:AraC-like DNA-binding protein